MRKILIVISIIALFIASYGYAYAQNFQDIPRVSRFYRAVEHLVNKGAIDADKSFFHSFRAVNRAEAVKMILIASGRDKEDVSGDEVRFHLRDVKNSEWYYPHAFRAIKLGIISGYPDGTFRG